MTAHSRAIFLATCTAVLVFTCLPSAQAEIIFYTSRFSWEAAIQDTTRQDGLRIIDFNDQFSPTFRGYRRIGVARHEDLILDSSLTVTNASTEFGYRTHFASSRVSPDDTTHLHYIPDNENPIYTLGFDEPVFAAGFDYANDQSSGGFTLRAPEGTSFAQQSFGVNNNFREKRGFIGFIDTDRAVESFTFRGSRPIGLDNISYVTTANYVPEPNAGILCSLAFALTLGKRRSRQAK